MPDMTKLRNRSFAAPIVVGVAVLGWVAAAQAQTGPPVISPGGTPLTTGSSFSGGFGIPGGTALSGGMAFTGSSISGGIGGTGNFTGAGFTGSAFTGGTANISAWRNGFSGNWAGSSPGGGTYRGSLSGGTPGGAAATGTLSVFYPFYANPLAAGAPNLTSMPQFNAPISAGSASGSLQGAYGGGYAGGFGGYPSGNYGFQGNASSPYGSNLQAGGSPAGTATAGRRAAPYYTTSPGFDFRPAGPNLLQTEVQAVLARSTALSPNRNIRVAVEGPAVVLRGTVASEQDRRLAEALVRLTPGVHEVRNELAIPGMRAQSSPGP